MQKRVIFTRFSGNFPSTYIFNGCGIATEGVAVTAFKHPTILSVAAVNLYSKEKSYTGGATISSETSPSDQNIKNNSKIIVQLWSYLETIEPNSKRRHTRRHPHLGAEQRNCKKNDYSLFV